MSIPLSGLGQALSKRVRFRFHELVHNLSRSMPCFLGVMGVRRRFSILMRKSPYHPLGASQAGSVWVDG
jgi:hypothetical protein